jgi:hypothetical protein
MQNSQLCGSERYSCLPFPSQARLRDGIPAEPLSGSEGGVLKPAKKGRPQKFQLQRVVRPILEASAAVYSDKPETEPGAKQTRERKAPALSGIPDLYDDRKMLSPSLNTGFLGKLFF